MNQVIEVDYPLQFREADAAVLGESIQQHNSVVLIGMKRVGISNFLRFFLYHPEAKKKYVQCASPIFVVIDLNNLFEKTLFAFWTLTLKRLVDAIEENNFSETIKKESQTTFTQSIQLRDIFFTIESVRKLAALITEENQCVTLFFLRFDRLKSVMNTEFLANIQGLRDSARNICFVFTSYRSLPDLIPQVFHKLALSGFVQEQYLKPTQAEDMKSILSTFQQQYDLKLSPAYVDELITLSGGHVQYLHLSLVVLKNSTIPKNASLIKDLLLQNEEIRLLSEELFASLTKDEQEFLTKDKFVDKNQDQHANYLWDTGMIIQDGKNAALFSPLFASYVHEMRKTARRQNSDFTKKEHLLFSLLKTHEGHLVERDTIIEAVWPEEVDLGVSDWSIDRLVSRLRLKLKNQKSEYRVFTVITRGYKLVKGKKA